MIQGVKHEPHSMPWSSLSQKMKCHLRPALLNTTRHYMGWAHLLAACLANRHRITVSDTGAASMKSQCLISWTDREWWQGEFVRLRLPRLARVSIFESSVTNVFMIGYG